MKKITLAIILILQFLVIKANAQLGKERRVIVEFSSGVVKPEEYFLRDELVPLRTEAPRANRHQYYILKGNGTRESMYLKSLQERGVIVTYLNDAVGYGCGVETPDAGDPDFEKQWYIENNGEFSLFGVKARVDADSDIIDAWSTTAGDSAIIIAILDTGIKLNHPEFLGRLWTNQDEIAGNARDDDNNGYIDDLRGWNFVGGNGNVADDNGHGTAIAGIIGANPGNGIALSGINHKCKLMICKVLAQDQSGFYSDWAAAIHYAVNNGANIINLSAVGESDLKILKEAVDFASNRGVLIVCSMGNDKSGKTYYPAGFVNTLAVGATDPDDRRSIAFNGNSNFGSTTGIHLDIVAPGNMVYGLNKNNNQADILWAGTSLSTAVVTGVASLALSIDNSLTAGELRAILTSSADDEVGRPDEDTKGWDTYHGFGRLNAQKALVKLQSGNYGDEDQIGVFPNPVSAMITIRAFLPSLDAVKMSIVDAKGTTVHMLVTKPLSPQLDATIDITGFSAGIYFINLQQNSRRTFYRFAKID